MSPTTRIEYLRLFEAHWARFLNRFEKSDSGTPRVIHELSAMYGGSDRHYHGIPHIIDGLDVLAVIRKDVPGWFADPDDDAAIELAYWEHDVIYSTTERHSEKRSAELAGLHADQLGFNEKVRLNSKMYVRATEHRRMMDWRRGACIVCDIDLAPLAATWERFCVDTANIRREYGHVPDDKWRQGRTNFLIKMLDQEQRPSIYQTDYFRDRYEAAARTNLERAIKALSMN